MDALGLSTTTLFVVRRLALLDGVADCVPFVSVPRVLAPHL